MKASQELTDNKLMQGILQDSMAPLLSGHKKEWSMRLNILVFSLWKGKFNILLEFNTLFDIKLRNIIAGLFNLKPPGEIQISWLTREIEEWDNNIKLDEEQAKLLFKHLYENLNEYLIRKFASDNIVSGVLSNEVI